MARTPFFKMEVSQRVMALICFAIWFGIMLYAM